MNRRGFLKMGGGVLAGAYLVGAFGDGALAQRGTPDSSADAARLWREYLASPDTHPQIPNVSYAGYARGERKIPKVTAETNVRDFGAKGDGETDDTAAINTAIEAAATLGGGAVLLPPGIYKTSGLIRMHYSGVVLRGLGRDKTTIYCEKSLEDGYATNQRGAQNQWSWSGGLIWFIPEHRLETLRAASFLGNEGWMDNETITSVTSSNLRGERVLTVADSGSLRAGEHVLLAVRNIPDSSLLKHMCGEVEGTETYDWNNDAERLRPERSDWPGAPNFVDYRWPVEVVKVEGNQVTLAQPLKTALRPEWEPRLRALGPVIRDAGIEDLTVRMRPSPELPHNQHVGFNGPCFQCALDCWARNVRVENPDVGFGMDSCRGVTFENVSVGSAVGRESHHPYACRVQAHDNLVANFRIETPAIHGINVEGFASGNAWSEGVMEHGTLDSHRAIPFENVRNDITVNNDGNVGGAGDAGPRFGARMTHWNVRVTNDRCHAIAIQDIAPYSATVGIQGCPDYSSGLQRDFEGDLESVTEALGEGVAPPNLYRAQLKERLE